MQHPIPEPFEKLPSLISASREKFDACLDKVDHSLTVDGITATLRFHHVRFDANGMPKFSDLAECLADHIVAYCFSASRRGVPNTHDEHTRLARLARKALRRTPTAGEAGEMLLYLLLESVLGAPQILSKVDMKTARKVESYGSDGLHMRWHPQDNLLDVFFGEAKLEQSIYAALSNAFKSITEFHKQDMRDFEFGLVTSHFKHAEPELRDAVLDYIDRQKPSSDCRINHACLIGYDWQDYAILTATGSTAITDEFRSRYLDDLPRLRTLIQKRFDNFKLTHLLFEVFFLPFRDVQAFRDAFNNALS